MARRRKSPRHRGAFRDRKTGVVLSRSNRHPMADLFTAIPANSADYPEATLPPFNMPEEMKQLIAVHVLDNLYPGLPAPAGPDERWHLVSEDGEPVVDPLTGQQAVIEGARYRLVTPEGGPGAARTVNGGAGQEWLPWTEDAEGISVAAVLDTERVPEVSDDMTDEELDVLQARVDSLRIDRARRKELDREPTKVEWDEWRKKRRRERGENPE